MSAGKDEDIRSALVALLPRLRRFAFTLCRTPEDADDLVQAVCERALARIDRWQPGTRLDSWMFRIMQNLHIDELRRSRHREGLVSPATLENVVGTDGARVAESSSTLAAVQRAMAALGPEQRAVLALVCVEQLSYREVAEILEVPVGTVMSRLARARRALHTQMNLPPEHSKP